MGYGIARKLLFKMSAEEAHHLSLKELKFADSVGVLPTLLPKVNSYPAEVMGLVFPNRVGLAAGLDKNADYIEGLAKLGFGFLEIGTVTPRPQAGNPKPRMFRMVNEQAIINRMGFNNKGLEHVVQQLQRSKFEGILGVNVGKNKDTPAGLSGDDYVHCIEKVYSCASYITINISSPNTPGLRALQFGKSLKSVLTQIKDCQMELEQKHRKNVPFVVKIAPDMSDEEVLLVARSLLDFDMNGVIATNTTLSRAGVESHPASPEQGGLSGKPLTLRATHIVKVLSKALENKIPIIASGGVMSAKDALGKIDAGASLVQLYSGLIYRGPMLVKEVAEALSDKCDSKNG